MSLHCAGQLSADRRVPAADNAWLLGRVETRAPQLFSRSFKIKSHWRGNACISWHHHPRTHTNNSRVRFKVPISTCSAHWCFHNSFKTLCSHADALHVRNMTCSHLSAVKYRDNLAPVNHTEPLWMLRDIRKTTAVFDRTTVFLKWWPIVSLLNQKAISIL